jgi:rare lipoprotein A
MAPVAVEPPVASPVASTDGAGASTPTLAAPVRVESSMARSDTGNTATTGGAETFAVTSPTIVPATSLAPTTYTQPRTSMPLPATPSGSPIPSATSPTPSPAPSRTTPSPGFWVQLGAFGQRDGAEGFQRHVASEMDWLAPVLAVFGDDRLYRLQAGPYADREQAQGVARRVRQSMQLTPMIVDRR